MAKNGNNGNGLTAGRMIKALEKNQGFITLASQDLGVSRQTFYNNMKKFQTVQDALDDIREKRHEYVENKLMEQIDEGQLTAIIFYLKTQAKHLGYVERQEVAGVKDQPIVNVFWNEFDPTND